MALKTKQDVNNEQWQPLQDDWLCVTGMCVCWRERGRVSVCGCACVGVCVRAWENFGGLWVDILCTVLRLQTDITVLVIFFIIITIIIVMIIITCLFSNHNNDLQNKTNKTYQYFFHFVIIIIIIMAF